MTKEELIANERQLQHEYDSKRSKLRIRYADSNNPHKIGDVAKDHIGFLKIERIAYVNDYETGLPSCVFYGTELTSGLLPKKRQDPTRIVYQTNIKP